MTEKSWFWDGTVRGDATEAPYSIDDFVNVLDHYSTDGSGYVIPEFGNSLNIVGSGITNLISIDTGALTIKGFVYRITALTGLIVHQNNTEYPRIDRVVMRINYTGGTNNYEVSLAVISGVPSVNPDPPECRNIAGVVVEVPLCSIYFEPGDYTTLKFVDERKFLNTPQHSMTYPLQNIMPNSEFFGAEAGAGVAPDMWTVIGTPSFNSVGKLSLQARGRAIDITCVQNEGMQIVLDTGTVATTHTLAVPVLVTDGACSITFGGITRYVYPTKTPTVCLIRVSTSGYQTLSIVGTTAGSNVFSVGQITLTQGYIQAPFSPKHEIVLYNNPLVLHSSFNSTGTTEYYFGNIFPVGMRGLIAELYMYDTGSSGAGPYFAAIQDPDTNADLLRIDCAGLPNSTEQSRHGIVKLKYDPAAAATLNTYVEQIQIAASGALTMFVQVSILGVIT